MFILASIFLTIFLIGIYFDYRNSRKEERETDRKAREAKAEKVREEIEEGIRNLNQRMG